AGQVVFELRQLDLELAFGASRVLREDVEDQLRAVDDASLQRILERALLRRGEFAVREQHLGVGVRVRTPQISELPLPDERAPVGTYALRDAPPHGRDARGARELPDLGELRGRVRALRVDANEEPALRLRPGRGIGLAGGHREIMPRYAPRVTALADRLAARTLELVNIASPSGEEK